MWRSVKPGSAGRSHARNTAFFLGALGTTLGGLGGGFAVLGLASVLIPDFAGRTRDWATALMIGVPAFVIGAWPLCDWLTNRRPRVGLVVMLGLAGVMIPGSEAAQHPQRRQLVVMLGLAGVMILLGGAAVLLTAWGVVAWLAVVGGLLLGAAGVLASLGGGTDPLTWTALNRSVAGNATWRRLDRRATAVLAVVVAITGSLSLLLLLRDRLDLATIAAAIIVLISTASARHFLRRRR